MTNIDCDKQGTRTIYRNSHWTAQRLAICIAKAIKDILGHTGRTSVRERHKDNLVAAARFPVPCMLADEGAPPA